MTDALRHEGIDSYRRVILLLLGESRIDDELDPWNRDGRFGDIGGEDDLAVLWWCRSEGLGLLSRGELSVKRTDEELCE